MKVFLSMISYVYGMRIVYLLLWLLLYGSLEPMAQGTALIQRELEQSPILKDHFFGFSLYDLEQNRFLAGVNEDKYFTPASNTKIFTLFASLKNIGDSIPGIHFVERGDSLLFWGSGDPTFLHPKLDSRKVYDFLAHSDKKLYYVGEELMEEPFYRHGWAIEDYDEYYQPEIRTFPVYGNVATFRNIRNRLTASPAYFQPYIVRDQTIGDNNRVRIHRKFDENIFLINNAKIPNNYVSEKPFKYSDELFVRLLQDTLHKPVELIRYAKPAHVDTLFSTATRDVLREMMLVSDNFLAEQLMLIAAKNRYDKFNTATLRKDMASLYYAFFMDQIDLYDSSGLSSYNKVTPRSLVELLLLIEQEVPEVDELRYLFPAGGVEGTLKATYRLDAGNPFVWAKTGTIKSVYCQSGYIQTRSGRKLVFSFLNNNFLGTAAPVRREVARIMTYIRENY